MPRPPRHLSLTERPEIPLDGLLLGYGAMLPFPAAAALVLAVPETEPQALPLLRLWAAAILLFLAGVRRGLSFRTEGGPRLSQIAMTLWLFGAGLLSLLLPPHPSLALQLAAYASLLALDPLAARAGEAPLYFLRLRPPQMAIPAASLALLLGLA